VSKIKNFIVQYLKIVKRKIILLLFINTVKGVYDFFEIKKKYFSDLNDISLLVIDMRFIPYTYDILVYLWRAKVEISNFDVLVYYDPIELKREGDQQWINNDNHSLLLNNIISQSAHVMGIKNYMIVSDYKLYTKISDSYKNNIYFTPAEIKTQNIFNTCWHYWLGWYIKNPLQVKVLDDPFWVKYFTEWLNNRSIINLYYCK